METCLRDLWVWIWFWFCSGVFCYFSDEPFSFESFYSMGNVFIQNRLMKKIKMLKPFLKEGCWSRCHGNKKKTKLKEILY